MHGVMFTIAFPGGRPSLREASFRLGVEASALDDSFGVALIDSCRGLYAVMVNEHAAAGLHTQGVELEGPFSNPAIGTFGPPEPSKT